MAQRYDRRELGMSLLHDFSFVTGSRGLLRTVVSTDVSEAISESACFIENSVCDSKSVSFYLAEFVNLGGCVVKAGYCRYGSPFP